MALAVLAMALVACDAEDIVISDAMWQPADIPRADDGGTDPGLDPGVDPGRDPASDGAPPEDPGPGQDDSPLDTDPGALDPGTVDPDPGPLTCVANTDQTIEAAELPVALGASPMFLSNASGTTTDVDVEGVDIEGVQAWDFRQGPSDVRTRMFVASPSGYWFADRFPGATFVSPLSAADPTVLAVYRKEAASVYLLGVASDVEAPPQGKTLAIYESPVPLFEFPLSVGRTYQAQTVYRDATLFGVPNAGRETYTITVDAAGTLLLPDFTLKNTLRLRIEAEQTLAIAPSPDPIKTVQYLWVHACMGEVARVMSQAGDVPYTGTAREFRRLGLGL